MEKILVNGVDRGKVQSGKSQPALSGEDEPASRNPHVRPVQNINPEAGLQKERVETKRQTRSGIPIVQGNCLTTM
jgi:hypothetical protein